MSVGQPLPLPPFTDLGALAEELARRGKNTKLRAAITQAWRAQSCLGDLRQAFDCCSALEGIIERPRSADTSALMATERALMTTAIMLYARATSTSGQLGERGSIQLERNKLSEQEWADHCSLLDVRNQAMAHVYSSRPIADHEWHRDVFFAVQVSNGQWKAASASNQTSFHAATLERLKRMLPVAHREVKEKFHKRIGAVTDMINREVDAKLILRHVFDPIPVFGNEEAVRAALAGAPTGETAFWYNEGRRAGDDADA